MPDFLSDDQAASLIDQATIPAEDPPSVLLRSQERASEDTSPVDGGGNQAGESGAAEEPDEAAAAEAESETAEEEAQPQEAPRVAPRYWTAAERELFGKLTPEVQDALIAQEGKRETIVQRARQESQAARQAAEAERTEFNKRVAALDTMLPQALASFQSRWSHVDWTTLSDQVGGEAALKLRAQYENERDQLQRLNTAQRDAMAEAERQFIKGESEALKTVAPDLADQAEGQTRRAELGRFLVAEGFPADRIRLLSAKEASIAYDAMRWREAEKRAREPKPKPAPQAPAQKQTPAGVRPSAATTQRNPQSARLQSLERKHRLSIAEATELQNLRSGARAP